MEVDHEPPIRAVALLSGGLDSTLAIRLVQEQGIGVVALNFTSSFCTCSPKRGGCNLAGEVARDLGVPIRVLVKGLDYLKIVERPRFGHGRGMNPCIDCRIYMLRKAAEVMAEEGASFVFTGEVLGQRPMSQHRRAMDLIERESGLAGFLLRPLSAHLLEPTVPEARGWVDRDRLLAIEGRSRREQLTLARERGVELFSCAAGGCRLTDPAIARRVRDLFRFCPDYDLQDARLCNTGRHFRLRDGLKAIVGRDETENLRLATAAPRYGRIELVDRLGPLMLARGEVAAGDLRPLGRLLRHYAKKIEGPNVVLRFSTEGRTREVPAPDAATPEEVAGWRI